MAESGRDPRLPHRVDPTGAELWREFEQSVFPAITPFDSIAPHNRQMWVGEAKESFYLLGSVVELRRSGRHDSFSLLQLLDGTLGERVKSALGHQNARDSDWRKTTAATLVRVLEHLKMDRNLLCAQIDNNIPLQLPPHDGAHDGHSEPISWDGHQVLIAPALIKFCSQFGRTYDGHIRALVEYLTQWSASSPENDNWFFRALKAAFTKVLVIVRVQRGMHKDYAFWDEFAKDKYKWMRERFEGLLVSMDTSLRGNVHESRRNEALVSRSSCRLSRAVKLIILPTSGSFVRSPIDDAQGA